jgi:hypothetical protein
VLNKSKYILYTEILQNMPFALMTALHTLGILSTSFTFSNSLEGAPTYAEHLLAAFPSHLKWVG